MYNLEILPVARADLLAITQYITFTLCNPISADRITEEILDYIEKLSGRPYIYQLFEDNEGLEHEYRKMIVGKYVILYWINEDIKLITISLIGYSASNYRARLK